MLSSAAVLGKLESIKAARVAMISVRLKIWSVVLPALIFPGQLAIKGTR